MRNTYNIYCVNKDKHMLVHLLKFMVAECGCNSADSALKGHIFAEAYSFPSTVPLLSVTVGPERFPIIMRTPGEGAKLFPGFTSI